jgi:excisionase family DNA binding protein
MDIEPNRIYTFDEVSKVLKLSPVTLRKLIRNGDVPASKFGKQYRLLGVEILKVFEKRQEYISH